MRGEMANPQSNNSTNRVFWELVLWDDRFGLFSNPVTFWTIVSRAAWRAIVRIFRLTTTLVYLFFRFIFFRGRKSKKKRVLTESPFQVLVLDILKAPKRVISTLRVHAQFSALDVLARTYFLFGYFEASRAITLKLARLVRRKSEGLYGHVLTNLIVFYTTKARWTKEYHPYTEYGLFITPKAFTGRHRFLGDQEFLDAKLLFWSRQAIKRDFCENLRLLIATLEATALLRRRDEFERCATFYKSFYKLDATSLGVLKTISAMSLNWAATSSQDRQVLKQSTPLFRGLHNPDYSDAAIFVKQPVVRFGPELMQHSSSNCLLPALEYPISFDMVFKGARSAHRTLLWYQAIELHFYKGVRLQNEGLILANDQAITRFVHVSDNYLALYCTDIVVDGDTRILSSKAHNPYVVEDLAAYCGYSANYYHWLVECMPRFALVKEWSRRTGNSPKYLLPYSLKRWQREMLKAIDILPHECIVDARGLGFYCLNLAVVDLPSYDMQSHPQTLQLLKRAMPKHWFAPSRAPSRKLFLGRKKSPLQRLGNAADVERIVMSHGYEVVYPEDLTFEEQIALFASASRVVAIGGAAITNCMFMPAGSKMLIMGPVDQIQPGTFSPLAEAAGVEVTYLAGDSKPFVNVNYVGTVFSYDTSLEDLEACLAALDAETKEPVRKNDAA